MKVARSLFSSKFIKASKAMSTPESFPSEMPLVLLRCVCGISDACKALGGYEVHLWPYLSTSDYVTFDYKHREMYC